MQNDKHKNCWDFFGECSKKDDCQAYRTESGQECWMVVENFKPCRDDMNFSTCMECPWFKEINEKS